MTDSRSYPDNAALRQVLEQARDFIDPDRDPPRINNRKLVMKINAVLSRVDAQAAENPVAWILPGEDTASDSGWLDARVDEWGEFTRPLYGAPQPPAQGSQEGTPSAAGVWFSSLIECLRPFAYYFDLNDCEGRSDGDALEIPVSDLRAARDLLKKLGIDTSLPPWAPSLPSPARGDAT